jgi:heme/copper-type cytochrome/quinol oxidase subunit 4
MKFIIGFLVTIGLIILAFILIFRGNGAPAVTTPDIIRYANTNVVMQLTIDGPINSQQAHRMTRITVGQSQVTMTTVQGYQNTVIQSKSYDNNTTAYTDFLHALQIAGYSKGTKTTSLADERGVCPFGNRFIYEIINGAQDSQRYWHSDCGSGNFKGSWSTVNSLFIRQVPDYTTLAVNSFSSL